MILSETDPALLYTTPEISKVLHGVGARSASGMAWWRTGKYPLYRLSSDPNPELTIELMSRRGDELFPAYNLTDLLAFVHMYSALKVEFERPSEDGDCIVGLIDTSGEDDVYVMSGVDKSYTRGLGTAVRDAILGGAIIMETN